MSWKRITQLRSLRCLYGTTSSWLLCRAKAALFALLALVPLCLLPPVVSAFEVSNDFSDFNDQIVPSMVWRHNAGELRAPLKIKDYVTNASVTLSQNFEVGNGAHSSFDPSTYSRFSENGDLSGNTITLNTETYSTLEVTSFHLESGWTLYPVGDNPLRIYALGSVTIEGIIDCSGGDGADFVEGGALGAAEGLGRCGGGSGGRGSSTVTGDLAGDGVFLGVTVPGGAAGGGDGPSAGSGATGALSGSAGGGGGAYTQAGAGREALAGVTAGGGAGGLAGEVGEDNDFQYSGGGAGGGGGAAYSGGGLGVDASGGGGGAGGGMIEIHAFGDVEIYPTGQVLANGGQGGSSLLNTYLSGGGGGGGGGSIKILAGGEVYASGPVEAKAGDGGDSGNTHVGGRGAEGRTWVAGRSGFSVALPPYALEPEDPASLLADVGKSRYQTGVFEWTSESVDLLSSRPEVLLAALVSSLSGSSSAKVLIATADSEGEASQFLDIDSSVGPQARYLKYRIEVVNDSEEDGFQIDEVRIEVTPFVQNDFEFGGGCGSVRAAQGSRGSNPARLLVFVVLFLPFALAVGLRSRF